MSMKHSRDRLCKENMLMLFHSICWPIGNSLSVAGFMDCMFNEVVVCRWCGWKVVLFNLHKERGSYRDSSPKNDFILLLFISLKSHSIPV